MELTHKQKVAVLKCVKRIIDADDKVTEEERKYMNSLAEKLGADSRMLAEAALMSDEELGTVIKELEPDDPFSESRNVVVDVMNEVAKIDGSFDKTELREYFKICEMALK